MSKTFVLGVGAQKAGTSWLYKQVSHHPGFKKGWTKEYHIWDVREVSVLRSGKRKLRNSLSPKRLDMYLMEKFPSRYFAHFKHLLSSEHSLACDISPSYCALSPETLLQIKQGMARNQIEFKCLFIMRDPVDRCLSAFNMIRNRSNGREIVSMSPDEDMAFMQYVKSEHAKIRTEYELTLAALRTSLTPEDYRILIYEEMFTTAHLDALQAYLGFSFSQKSASEKVFANEYNTSISQQAKAFCRKHFTPTYDAVARDFPQVKTLWAH
tara:strand:+ start:2263 stop:3063 length:801 start_codon:yes stop_codon:yes gene_type:complete